MTVPLVATKRKRDVDHDAGLVPRALRGDQDAWVQLYRAAYPRLVAFAARRLGDVDAGRDAVSETMARAVASIDSYTGGDAGFAPWLFGICRHVIADTQRKALRPLPPGLLRHDVPVPGVAELLVEGEEQAAVRDAFRRLDAEEREVLELRVVAGLSSAEVAVILGKQASAVRMAQKRALARLRAFVEEATRVG